MKDDLGDVMDLRLFDFESKLENDFIDVLTKDSAKSSERAKKDRELRKQSRQLFKILSDLLHRVQNTHSLDVEDEQDDDDHPSDTHRCRDSDLRTLRKANKTLEALIDMSRDLKKKKREAKAMKKLRDMKERKRKKIKRSSSVSLQSSGDSCHREESQVSQDEHVSQKSLYNQVSPYAQPSQAYFHTPQHKYASHESPFVHPSPAHMFPPPSFSPKHEQTYQTYPFPPPPMFSSPFPDHGHYHDPPMYTNQTRMTFRSVDISSATVLNFY